MLEFIFKQELVLSLIVVFLGIVTYSVLKNIVRKIINFKNINVKKQETFTSFFVNIIRYVIFIIVVLILLEIFGVDTAAIIASLGVVGVVAGLAVKDLLQDFVSGVALVLDDTYNIGDWVTINAFKGEVTDIGMRNTRVKSYTGEVLIINNGSITSVVNHSIEDILIIVDVKISFNEDSKKVEKVLTKYCEDMKDKVSSLKGEMSFLGLEEIDDSFLVYRIVLEVTNGTQFEEKRKILKTLKEELNKNNIVIPYQQLVIHNERV